MLETDFEAGLDGWVPRGDAQGNPTVETTGAEAHGGTRAALVSGRTSQGDGIGRDVTAIMVPGVTYQITAWVKFAAGQGNGAIWLSMQRVNGGASSFDTVAQTPGVTDGAWSQVSARYLMASADTAFLYFETTWPDGTSASFLVDDVVVTALDDPDIEDLTPIKDTVDFNMGVAVDSRETAGSPAALVRRHFDQLTPENHMKPEAWYDAGRTFAIHPEATAIMDFAQANDLDVYGHTLVWHSQTPAWFFTRDDGTPLTNGAADQQVLRDRLRSHIFGVAEKLSTAYGPFGSETNPLVAFDVVNEVVSDASTDDGLRRSRWYDVLGESYIDLAFRYADEAFNGTYAIPGPTRPVLLAINDYNTEQEAKRLRLRALVNRLLGRGVPVDAVGHQFHLSLSTPIQSLEDAIVAFADLPVTQVVSELDVTTGTPVTEARLIDQGYFYRDAFRVLREHADELFSVTVWGLTDGRSWRVASGAPLVFDDELQAKPAYHGIVDGELPPRQRSAFVFMAEGDLGIGADEWERLPLHAIEAAGAFQLRWRADALVALVRVVGRHARRRRSDHLRRRRHELRGQARRRRRRAGAGRGVVRGLGRARRAAALRRGDRPAGGVRRPGHRRGHDRRLERAGRHGDAHPRRGVSRTRRRSRRRCHRRSTARSTASGRSRTPSRPTSQFKAPAARRRSSGRSGARTRCTSSRR